MEVKEKKGISELTFDQLTLLRNKLGDEIKAAEAAVDVIKKKREKVDTEFLRRFNEQGLTSVKTKVGTPYIITYESFSVADKDAFTNWIEQTGALDFLEVRANKSMVSAYKEEHNDLPPGINYSATLKIGVKKS